VETKECLADILNFSAIFELRRFKYFLYFFFAKSLSIYQIKSTLTIKANRLTNALRVFVFLMIYFIISALKKNLSNRKKNKKTQTAVEKKTSSANDILSSGVYLRKV
jgi:hypothetical protein